MRIVDSHTHLSYRHPETLISMADHFGFDKLAVMAIPLHRHPLNTLECLLMKKLAPGRVYVYGGMNYFADEAPTAAGHERQLQLMMDAGCDGWKILESKPSVYRALQQPLDGEAFSKAFAMAERESIPITWHAGDPATFWDVSRAPEFAVRNNWLCIGEGFPTLEKIYSEVENVMARHPRLRVSMAHLYFISDDRPHGERLLDTYENFWLDITPGSEMYYAFAADPEGWTEFFNRYQDKIVFGTDMEDCEGDVVFGNQDEMFNLTYRTLATDRPVNVMGMTDRGLGLAPDVLQKIFAENFESRAGRTPRALSRSGLNAYVDWLMPRLSREDRKMAEDLLNSASI